MYIATKYIGTDYTPGEVLPDDVDEAIIKRLLKSGAIREAAPEPVRIAPEPALKVDDVSTSDAEEDAEETEDTEEAEDEEPEAPEVDAAAALVQEDEERPKSARTRKGGKAK